METIDITDVMLERHEDYQEMSAIVDGDRIWFRFPLFMELEPRAEIFMAPAMVEGMVRGLPVRITDDIAISYKLARNYEEIQALLKSWNNDFTISPLLAQVRKDFPATDNVISCFSGGIDSSYTYAKYQDDITHILLMQGFDNSSENEIWAQNVATRQAFADAQGIKLITVETNIRSYCEERGLDFGLMHGSLLCTVGILLNPGLFLIPSTYSYETLHPWGSHPLLDPLWATDTTDIIHHGCAASRCEKTAFIANNQPLLDQIQVCWKSCSSNCGECSKCVRTSLALKMMGQKSANLPEFSRQEQYEALTIVGKNNFYYVEELIEFAREKGKEDVIDHLAPLIRSYEVREKIHNFIKILLGRPGAILSRYFSKNPWYMARATVTSNKRK